MKAFLAVSVAPHRADEVRGPLRRALAVLTDGCAGAVRVDRSDDGWVAFVGGDGDDVMAEPGGAFTIRLSRAARTIDRDVDTAELPAMMETGSTLSSLLPPFAAAHRSAPGAPVVVAGDWLGCRQLYRWLGDGVAAVSTSARALSVLSGGGLDLAGLGGQSLLGWQLGQATVFDGVHVLPPATVVTLHGGRLHQRRYAEPPATPERPAALADVVEEMAVLLSTWQTGYLEQHPDTVLQLSGGQDSRILLAAVPRGMRDGLRALTLGDDDSPDVVVAAGLAARWGIRHRVHRLDDELWPAPRAAHELAMLSARELECQASPLALAPLLLAEEGLDQGHRLSGLGGEVARGFYYVGQPANATTSPRLVERLARWRLFSNEAVAAEALEPDFLRQARATTVGRLKELFPPGDWLPATDEFYLLHRMHRWAAAHGTVAAVRRHFINPLLDRRFVELALAAAPGDKRDGRLWGHLTQRLDPDLARMPLDSGLVPARLAHPTAASRLSARAGTVCKLTRRVRQRLAGSGSPQFGAAQAAAAVLAHWRAHPSACRDLYELPFLRRAWLTELLADRRPAPPTTVAFLVNLLAATEQPVATGVPVEACG